MDTIPSTPFRCPHCKVEYKLVRAKAGEGIQDREVTCLSCGGPLETRDGAFVRKYFLVDKPEPSRDRRA